MTIKIEIGLWIGCMYSVYPTMCQVKSGLIYRDIKANFIILYVWKSIMFDQI